MKSDTLCVLKEIGELWHSSLSYLTKTNPDFLFQNKFIPGTLKEIYQLDIRFQLLDIDLSLRYNSNNNRQ